MPELLPGEEIVLFRMLTCHCGIVDAKEGFQEALTIADFDSESGLFGTTDFGPNLGNVVSRPPLFQGYSKVYHHVRQQNEMFSVVTRSQVFRKKVLAHELRYDVHLSKKRLQSILKRLLSSLPVHTIALVGCSAIPIR